MLKPTRRCDSVASEEAFDRRKDRFRTERPHAFSHAVESDRQFKAASGMMTHIVGRTPSHLSPPAEDIKAIVLTRSAQASAVVSHQIMGR